MSYYKYGSMNNSAIIMGQINVFDQLNAKSRSLEKENVNNVSDYNNLLARYRALRGKYNSLVNEWNELEGSHNKKVNDHTSLLKIHNDLVVKFNALVDYNDSLLKDLNRLDLTSQQKEKLNESQIVSLGEKLESTQKVARDTITDFHQSNAALKNKLHELQLFKSTTISSINKNRERFALDVKKNSLEAVKHKLALKVTTTQSYIYRLLLEKDLTGIERLEFIIHQINDANSQDDLENNFSYNDAYTWLKRNDQKLLNQIDLF